MTHSDFTSAFPIIHFELYVFCLQGTKNVALKITFDLYETENNGRIMNNETPILAKMGRWL